MGGSDHTTIAPLWSEVTTYQREPRPVQGYGGWRHVGEEIPGTRKTTRTDLTVREVWDTIKSEEGYESGHSYSGNFAVKPGYIVFGTADVDTKVLEEAGSIVATIAYHEDDEWDPLKARVDTRCDYRAGGWGSDRQWCSSGKVTVEQDATLADGTVVKAKVQVDCPQCKGTGRRPFTEDEQKAETERQARVKAAVDGFGLDNLKRAGQQYGDKWGDACALVTKTHVWFGGVCSS